MDEMRKKWLQSETKYNDLEAKYNLEKSILQKKIDELNLSSISIAIFESLDTRDVNLGYKKYRRDFCLEIPIFRDKKSRDPEILLGIK